MLHPVRVEVCFGACQMEEEKGGNRSPVASGFRQMVRSLEIGRAKTHRRRALDGLVVGVDADPCVAAGSVTLVGARSLLVVRLLRCRRTLDEHEDGGEHDETNRPLP